MSWPSPQAFEQAEIEIAEQVAQVMVQAVERIEINEREHRIATELQERLLDLKARSNTAVFRPPMSRPVSSSAWAATGTRQ